MNASQAILLLAIASANAGISLRAVEPMLPQLAQDFGTSVSHAALVITGFGFAYGFGQLLHGGLGDRYGKLRVVTWSLAGASLASLGCGFVDSLSSMLAWRVLTGACASASVMLGIAYVGDVVPVAERQAVIARFVAGSIVGQALGPFTGGIFTDFFGWRATFFFLAGVFAVVAAMLWHGTRPIWHEGPRTSGPFLSLSRYAGILRIAKARTTILCGVAETICFFGVFSFMGAMLKARYDLSFTLIGAILACFGVGGLIYSSAAPWLLRRLGQRRFPPLGGVLCFIGCVSIAFVPWWPIAIPAMTLMSFAYYMLHNTLQVKATEMAPQARGTAVSMFAAGWSLGQATGTAIMGAGVATLGYPPMIAGMGFAFAALGFWVHRNFHRLP